MEEFSILVLDGDKVVSDLKILLANIVTRKPETTERKAKQRERAHQRNIKQKQ